ncbi:MAG: iron-sulfur cluster assembly scaffold protein [Leptospiraceae bacterium]|nr:iron-sulfur cluster assembly scaffold protein [Leptospiraceae bacterium]MCB1199115.1 iron-sulfur cluster assembly scaffold protein [Leptospiraceae bacterium]
MNFDKFNAIVESRLHYGEIDAASVVSEFKNVGCGDNYRIFLKVEDNIIQEATYTTTGCSFSLASLSIICDLVKGKTLEEAKQIQIHELEDYIEGYPERRTNYAHTAITAIAKAVDDYIHGTGLAPEKLITRENALKKLKTNGHLKGEMLNSVMLDGLDLNGVDFSGASLQNAYFRKASLRGANFEGANLKGAFLNETDLSEANLKAADLRFAKLSGASLEGADFENALYDIGTRVDTKNMHIFEKMQQKGKELYLKADLSTQ